MQTVRSHSVREGAGLERREVRMWAFQVGSMEMRAQEARPRREVGKEAESSSELRLAAGDGQHHAVSVQVEESEEFLRSFELRSTHTMQDATAQHSTVGVETR